MLRRWPFQGTSLLWLLPTHRLRRPGLRLCRCAMTSSSQQHGNEVTFKPSSPFRLLRPVLLLQDEVLTEVCRACRPWEAPCHSKTFVSVLCLHVLCRGPSLPRATVTVSVETVSTTMFYVVRSTAVSRGGEPLMTSPYCHLGAMMTVTHLVLHRDHLIIANFSVETDYAHVLRLNSLPAIKLCFSLRFAQKRCLFDLMCFVRSISSRT